MAKHEVDIDETDRKIISFFEANPDMSQLEMAKAIGISQPSVGARLRKLKERGIIAHMVGMNFKKVGLNLAKVDIETNESVEILDSFRKCPYFLNGFIISGNKNVCLLLMAENISTIEAIVDGHLRKDPRVKNVDMDIIISPVEDLIFPVKLTLEKTCDDPCNPTCGECSYYVTERCLGCPMTEHYRGDFW